MGGSFRSCLFATEAQCFNDFNGVPSYAKKHPFWLNDHISLTWICHLGMISLWKPYIYPDPLYPKFASRKRQQSDACSPQRREAKHLWDRVVCNLHLQVAKYGKAITATPLSQFWKWYEYAVKKFDHTFSIWFYYILLIHLFDSFGACYTYWETRARLGWFGVGRSFSGVPESFPPQNWSLQWNRWPFKFS